MKITYIFGNNKSNKTSLAIQKAKQFQDKGESVVYIVPEQTTMSTEKMLIDEIKSILNIQVYSFMRLSDKIFDESGIGNLTNLDETGKLLLLKLIVNKNENSFKYYKNGINKSGFISELSEFLTESYKYSITIDDFKKVIENENTNDTIKLKLHDIVLILEEYNKYIKTKFISTDDTLDLLALKMEDSKYLKGINVIVDGFYGLTEQEYKVIDKLCKCANSITVVFNVNVTKKTAHFENLNKYDPYFEPKMMVNKFTQIITDNNLKVTDIVLLENIKNENEDLNFLKMNFLKNRNKEVYEKEIENIKINVAKNIVDEVSITAKEIIKFKNEGCSFNDIKVICSDLEQYKSIISGVFDQYEIPFFIDKKEDIFMNSLSVLIIGVLNVVINSFSFESVMNLLKADIFAEDDFSYEEIEDFENYLLLYGIKGYEFKKEFYKGENNKKINLEQINNTRLKFLNIIDCFSKDFTLTKKYTVLEITSKIMEFLNDRKVYLKIDNIIEQAKDDNNLKLKKEYEQIWEKYIDLFEKIVDVLGNEKVRLKEYYEILLSGIESISLAVIPLSIEEVTIGDVMRSKFSKSKVVFLIGATDSYYPSKPNEKSIINDAEREIIKSTINNIQTSNDAFLKEQLLIYDSLLIGDLKVFISYPLYSFDGNLLNPSPIIKKLTTMFTKLEPSVEREIYITNKETMFEYVLTLLKKQNENIELTENEQKFLSIYKDDDYYDKKINILESVINDDYTNQNLSKGAINLIYNNKLQSSVSKLEKYAKCPFSYFLEYNLYLKERKIFEVQNVDIGSVFHEILDRFTIFVENENLDSSSITEEEVSLIVDNIIKVLVEEKYLETFISNDRYNHFLNRIISISKKSIFALVTQLSFGEFKVFGTEIEFTKKINKIVLDFDDERTVILTGKIDRVDILDNGDEKYIKIIDYKSSSKKLDEKEILQGTQLQLITYLDILLNNSAEIFKDVKSTYLPGGVYYFEIKNPSIEKTEFSENEDLSHEMLQEFRLQGKTINDVEVLSKIDKNIEPSKKSDIVNVTLKKDNTISSRSDAYTIDEFNDIRAKVNDKIVEICSNIFEGDISIDYDKADKLKACKYCDLSGICKRDVPSKE